METAKAEVAKLQPLMESKCKSSEYARNIWCAAPELNVTVEDVQRPEFWANVASLMRIHDRIEVISEDSSWFAELMVLDKGKLWAKVALMREVKFGKHEIGAGSDEEFTVRWNGGAKCFRVIRKSDNAVMQDNLKDKADGHLWIANYNKDLAA